MCIFCDIIKGDIPSYKIYEDEYTYAFLDISNDVEGHTLVVPKEHCENILSASRETLDKVMESVQKISKHYIDLGYTGINILNNNGSDAEQSVMHLHFHIIPRKTTDDFKIFPTLSKTNADLKIIADNLRIE